MPFAVSASKLKMFRSPNALKDWHLSRTKFAVIVHANKHAKSLNAKIRRASKFVAVARRKITIIISLVIRDFCAYLWNVPPLYGDSRDDRDDEPDDLGDRKYRDGHGHADIDADRHGPNMMMVPRCAMKVEKCPGGMKITCSCDDPAACTMMQNLCAMMAGGMCGLCCTMNGMMVCNCNLMMGMLQDGDDRQRVHDDVHQRGQDVRRHDPGVLRLRHGVHEGWPARAA